MTLFTLHLAVSFLTLTLAYFIGRACLSHLAYERKLAKLGCSSPRRYPSWDRVSGLDYVCAMMRALRKDRLTAFLRDTYAAMGWRPWTANFLGTRMVYTTDPAHMKALSTTHRECFAIEPIRVGNGALAPFTGRGVSSSDGPRWAASRELVLPYFDRAAFTNLNRLRSHADRLLSKIPSDGSTVDMQPLLQRWFLDTSTEFLFGETVNCLDYSAEEWPRHDMMIVMKGLTVRLLLGSLLFLHRDKRWLAACGRIHDFLDGYIQKAYEDLEQERRNGTKATYADGRLRDDFLWTLASQIPDALELRTQLTGVWIPSNQTTSILVSNALFALARHPEVVRRLRQEVLKYVSEI
ncbi:cytochrome P450 [Hypoxylon sp. NC1633]|nr:cytochrome P450 [Hypoxylon sp. NC1633]